MAKFQAGRGGNFDVNDEWEFYFEPMDPFSETSTKAVFKDSLGNKVTMFGSNLNASNEDNIKGTVTRVLIEDDRGNMIFDVTQLSMAYKNLWGPVQNDWEYGIADFMTVLMAGDDKFFGTDGGEHIPMNLDPGDDIIKAMGGDDFVRAASGNNDMDGGKGTDSLAYHTYWYGQAPQTRGVEMDVAAGTAINPWGGKDKINGFEIYRLSIRADDVKGSNADEHFDLLDGKDRLDGRGGFDTVGYARDASYDGGAGVTVNLGKGTATDGFGKSDKLISIEGVVGSASADKLTGSDLHNEIAGLEGKDSLTGKGGSDTFIFNFGFGKDTIEDFQMSGNKHDVIRVVDFDDFKNFSDVKPLIEQVGDDVVINKGGDDEITILNADADKFTKDHFEFG